MTEPTLEEIEAALEAATPGPWAVKDVNLGRIGTQDEVVWPWVFAVNPMPIPAAHGATTGPLIGDLTRRHDPDPDEGLDYAHGGIVSIETTDGRYRERDAADAHLIANAPSWLAALVQRVKVAEAESLEYQDGYELWRADGQRMHAALLSIWRALGPDREYGVFQSPGEVSEEVLAAIGRVRETHRPSTDHAEGMDPYCVGCWEAGGMDGAPSYPCPVIKALGGI